MSGAADDDPLQGGWHRAGPAAHGYGGQLRQLHEALCDPLCQQTSIVLLGDSITWGLGLADNAEVFPRNHSLSDPRDLFHTRSWANEFKRAIGRDYFFGADARLSNWPASLSGESTVTYRRRVALYPGLPPFLSTLTGSATGCHEMADGAALLGYIFRMTDEAGQASQSLSFPFTGTEFELVFTSIAAHNPMDYELIVGGLSQGIFSTMGSNGHGARRTHQFAYVRRQQIEIRARRTLAAGVQHLELEAVCIDKQCRITNQGLIGSNAMICLERSCGALGPAAVCEDDDFVLIQFGTNDRSAIFSKYRQPDSINNFARNMHTLVGRLESNAELILMAPGPVAGEPSPEYAFSMLDVRNALNSIARHCGIDLVDHYAAQRHRESADILSDRLHPNRIGHALIAANLLHALRYA
ncbi:SGNH/GDSL hydrolase family protein [Massilia genomosp. 1]|nr:SGNH/GDSL hydrolase family protein [Massilia genomosp. 1]